MAEVLSILDQSAGRLLTGREPDLLERVGAALEYVEAFPDRFHHPKEEEYLFAALRRATGEGEDVLRQLEEEHRRGTAMRGGLKACFVRIVHGETQLLERFVADVRAYVHFQREHMRVEEKVVLPLAVRTLTQDDWHAIASAFLDDHDPRFGADARQEFARLLKQVKPHDSQK